MGGRLAKGRGGGRGTGTAAVAGAGAGTSGRRSPKWQQHLKGLRARHFSRRRILRTLTILFGALVLGIVIVRSVGRYFRGYKVAWKGGQCSKRSREAKRFPWSASDLDEIERVARSLSAETAEEAGRHGDGGGPIMTLRDVDHKVPGAISHICACRAETWYGAATSIAEVLALRKKEAGAMLAQYREGSYFVAANLHDNAAVFPSWQRELVKLVAMLENVDGGNVFVSIYESGSTDDTKRLLRLLEKELTAMGVPHSVQTTDVVRGEGEDRIPFLASMRNRVLQPLYQSSSTFDQVLFLNDVYFCAEDMLSLVHQTRGDEEEPRGGGGGGGGWGGKGKGSSATARTREGRGGGADMACSTDWIGKKPGCKNCADFRLYDIWVGMDVDGYKFMNEPPYIHHRTGRKRLKEGHPFQVFSCWNGMVSIDADIFQQDLLRIRAGREGLECAASECELLARDLWEIGRGRVVVVPSAVVAYDFSVFVDKPRHEVQLGRKAPIRGYQDVYPKRLVCCPLPKGQDSFDTCFDDTVWRAVYSIDGVPRAASRGDMEATTTTRKEERDDANNGRDERSRDLTFHDMAAGMKREGGDEFTCSRAQMAATRQRLSEYAIPPLVMQSGRSNLVADYSFEVLRGPIAWMSLHPCYDFVFLDDATIHAFVQEHYPQFLPLLESSSTPPLGKEREGEGQGEKEKEKKETRLSDAAGKVRNGGELADFARYLFMFHMGGVYADIDTLPVRPISGMLDPMDTFVVGLESDFTSDDKAREWAYARARSLSLHAFAVAPKNDIMWKVVTKVAGNLADPRGVYEEVHRRARGSAHHLETIFKTGPGVFTDVVLGAAGAGVVVEAGDSGSVGGAGADEKNEDKKDVVRLLGIPAFSSGHVRGKDFYSLQRPSSLSNCPTFVQHFNLGTWLRSCRGNTMRAVAYDYMPSDTYLQTGQWMAVHVKALAWREEPLYVYPPLSRGAAGEGAVDTEEGEEEGGPSSALMFLQLSAEGFLVAWQGLGPLDPNAKEMWRLPDRNTRPIGREGGGGEGEATAAAAAAGAAAAVGDKAAFAALHAAKEAEAEGTGGKVVHFLHLEEGGNLSLRFFVEGDYWDQAACKRSMEESVALWDASWLSGGPGGDGSGSGGGRQGGDKKEGKGKNKKKGSGGGGGGDGGGYFAVLRPDGRLATYAGRRPLDLAWERYFPAEQGFCQHPHDEEQQEQQQQQQQPSQLVIQRWQGQGMRPGDWLGSGEVAVLPSRFDSGKVGDGLALVQHHHGALCAHHSSYSSTLLSSLSLKEDAAWGRGEPAGATEHQQQQQQQQQQQLVVQQQLGDLSAAVSQGTSRPFWCATRDDHTEASGKKKRADVYVTALQEDGNLCTYLSRVGVDTQAAPVDDVLDGDPTAAAASVRSRGGGKHEREKHHHHRHHLPAPPQEEVLWCAFPASSALPPGLAGVSVVVLAWTPGLLTSRPALQWLDERGGVIADYALSRAFFGGTYYAST